MTNEVVGIEVEYKYVFRLDDNFLNQIIDNVSLSSPTQIIEQYYLSGGGRIRESKDKNCEANTSLIFNYKEKLPGAGYIEIEKQISRDIFEKLKEVSINNLKKTRVYIETKDHTWEIDFFQNEENDNCYFCMMECELTSDQIENNIIPNINQLPELVSKNIIYILSCIKQLL